MSYCSFGPFNGCKAAVLTIELKPPCQILRNYSIGIAPYTVKRFLEIARLNLIMPNSTAAYFPAFADNQVTIFQFKFCLVIFIEIHFIQVV